MRPSFRRKMAQHAVDERGVSVALACRAFSISQRCFRYVPLLSDENEEIEDWLIALTKTHKNWGFGLCYLYLRNIKGFKWNHKRVRRIYDAWRVTSERGAARISILNRYEEILSAHFEENGLTFIPAPHSLRSGTGATSSEYLALGGGISSLKTPTDRGDFSHMNKDYGYICLQNYLNLHSSIAQKGSVAKFGLSTISTQKPTRNQAT